MWAECGQACKVCCSAYTHTHRCRRRASLWKKEATWQQRPFLGEIQRGRLIFYFIWCDSVTACPYYPFNPHKQLLWEPERSHQSYQSKRGSTRGCGWRKDREQAPAAPEGRAETQSWQKRPRQGSRRSPSCTPLGNVMRIPDFQKTDSTSLF